MKKEEIKYDPVRDNFLKTISYISSNPNNFLKVAGLVSLILLVFIIYANNSSKQKLSDNKFISIATNKHLDNKIDLSIPNFKKFCQHLNLQSRIIRLIFTCLITT